MKHRNKFIIYVLMLTLILSGCEEEVIIEKEVVYTNVTIPKEIYKSDEKYYYLHITSDEYKEIYNQIYDTLAEKSDCIELKIGDASTLEKIFRMVIFDNVDLFYVESFKYIQKDEETIKFMPIYYMCIEEIEQAEHEIYSYTQKILNNITYDMDTFTKEKIIYDFIVSHTEYDISSKYGQSIYSVVQNKSVCAGYSFMFKYLCEKVDIPCIVITGSTKEGISHAWNAVYLGNNWYMVDCANDKDENGEVTYKFFNVTREQILRSYNINNLVEVPECTSILEEYYYKMGLYFEQVDIGRFSDLIHDKQSKSENELVIRCADSNIYDDMEQCLLTDGNLLNIIGNDISVTCNFDRELLLISLKWK